MVYIVLTVLFVILIFFIWSNYQLIKNHINLEQKLDKSLVELDEVKKQYNSHIYQLNKDLVKVRHLENLLISKELKKVQKEKDLDKRKEIIKQTFVKMTPPTNKELEGMEDEIDYL